MKASPLTELPPDLARPRGHRSHIVANIITAGVLLATLGTCVTFWLVTQ